MSDQHLGDQVHDLLDNRLTPAQTSQAMAHLDECEQCRARWDELRAAREALHSSQAGIDMRFTQQLLDRDRMAEIAKGESRHHAKAARGRNRRPMIAALIVFAVLGATMGTAYFIGDLEEVSLEFADEAPTSGEAVSLMRADTMREGAQLRSWVHPNWEATGLVPVEAAVLRDPNGENVLFATVLANLEPIVVTEQHGRLPGAKLADLPRVDLGHTSAYLVKERPLRLVWQTGDVVISVTCSCAATTLEAVAASFPAVGAPGPLDRMTEGLQRIADTLTGN